MKNKKQFFQWLNTRFLNKKPKKIITGGAYADSPNYYVDSGWGDIEINKQKTKIKLVEDTGGTRFLVVNDSFSFGF